MAYLSKLSNRLALRIAAVAAASLLAACADDSSPVAPAQPAAPSVGLPASATPTFSTSSGTSGKSSSVKRGTKVDSDVVASVDVDVNGGELSIGKVGFRLVIPPFAVLRKTRITVTAKAGGGMLYEFEPHGIRFNVPLLLEQDLSSSSFESYPLSSPVLGYYDAATVDLAGAAADVLEWLPSGVDYRSKKFYGLISHFSGYMVSSGR